MFICKKCSFSGLSDMCFVRIAAEKTLAIPGELERVERAAGSHFVVSSLTCSVHPKPKLTLGWDMQPTKPRH